jgi:hypothetical protein
MCCSKKVLESISMQRARCAPVCSLLLLLLQMAARECA